MKTIAKIAVFVVVGALIAGVVQAQFGKPEDAIKYRKATMFLIVQHFKRMGAAVQGKTPYNKQDFAANAEVVKVLATLPWEAMLEPGTDRGDTRLSPAVFSETRDFKKDAMAFEAATAQLARISQDQGFDAIKAQFGAVAGSCSACHKAFRK
jgi:cytochrome c556